MEYQFEIGNGEFGEIYHLAAAAFLLGQINKQIAVRFSDFPAGEEFFRFLSIETSQWESGMKRSHLPSTADVIRDHFRPGCLNGLVAAIRRLAQKDNWHFPFPELANGQQKVVIWQRNKNYQ